MALKRLLIEINFKVFEPIVKAAKISGIKRFIYASSSSVYGVSNKKNVRENHPLLLSLHLNNILF